MPYKKTSSKSVSVSDLVGEATSPAQSAPVSAEEKVEEVVVAESTPVDSEPSVEGPQPASFASAQSGPSHRIHVDHDGPSRHYGGNNGGGSYHHQQSVQVTPTEEVKGFLDVQPEGHGFLRPKFVPSS